MKNPRHEAPHALVFGSAAGGNGYPDTGEAQAPVVVIRLAPGVLLCYLIARFPPATGRKPRHVPGAPTSCLIG